MPAAGDLFSGHRLVEKLGAGHFGEVWKAEYMGHHVALKVFTSARRANVRREAFAQYALGRLDGDDGRHFPRIEHIELDADPPWLRMEYIDGKPLEELLLSPTAPLEERLALGLRILEALDAVHRHGYVHGDLSPANILVTRAGEVKLIDVGYGAVFDDGGADIRLSGGPEEFDQGFGVASPLYAAPERFHSEFLSGCGKPADVFSFGKILYGLVTGEQPFVIKPVSLKFRALGSDWDDFVFSCLEEKPETRPADAGEALQLYRRLYRPETKKGEFRAECPKCQAKASIPGGWAGERFPCGSCGAMIEVLFYDETNRSASTALVETSPTPDIQFLDDASAASSPAPSGDDVLVIGDDGSTVGAAAPSSPPPATRARKFCPRCGQSIYAEAKKCRHCGTWVDELARKIAENTRKRTRSR